MKLAIAALCALASLQQASTQPWRDALLFGALDATNMEAIVDPAAAARWKEVQRRARAFQSRLRPPPSRSGEMSMVWDKRRHYERLFAAVGVPYYATASDERVLAEEVADFIQGMRPCYEWEGSYECPLREAEFAEHWMRHFPNSGFAAYLPLFAGNRLLCAAVSYDAGKESARAADARRRATAHLKRAADGKDPLFRLAARQMLADSKCLVTVY